MGLGRDNTNVHIGNHNSTKTRARGKIPILLLLDALVIFFTMLVGMLLVYLYSHVALT